jgi:superfamily II DNA or RNA helicase
MCKDDSAIMNCTYITLIKNKHQIVIMQVFVHLHLHLSHLADALILVQYAEHIEIISHAFYAVSATGYSDTLKPLMKNICFPFSVK